jgi:hypothetical protein
MRGAVTADQQARMAGLSESTGGGVRNSIAHAAAVVRCENPSGESIDSRRQYSDVMALEKILPRLLV